ncbi:hypothetical protein BJY52DRAFT_1191305 [Lactarius psammicola]|nr:hypothetical protein BJY52DRAFT_1191305 [Lactarius psammicola]
MDPQSKQEDLYFPAARPVILAHPAFPAELENAQQELTPRRLWLCTISMAQVEDESIAIESDTPSLSKQKGDQYWKCWNVKNDDGVMHVQPTGAGRLLAQLTKLEDEEVRTARREVKESVEEEHVGQRAQREGKAAGLGAPLDPCRTREWSDHIGAKSSSASVEDLPPPIPHNNAALPPAPLASSLNMASSSARAPLRVDENLTGVTPPGNDDTFVPDLLHAARQITVESHRIPAISPEPPTAGPKLRVIDRSASTTPRSTPALQHAADFRISFDAPDVPSSPSPTATLDAMTPMGTLSSSEPPATRSDDRAQSRSESHSLLSATAPLVTASPAPSSQQEPAPHLSATAEGEGSAVVALRRNREILDLPL